MALGRRLPALHFSVNFVCLSFEIICFIVELLNYKRITDEGKIAENS